MGYPMAENLLKGGVALTVWNRSVEKSAQLKAAYGELVTVAETPADVVRAADVTYSMLSNLEAHEAVSPLALQGVSSGKAIVDCATLTPETMRLSHAAITSAGGRFLEAPVSGSKKPAEDGTLIFLASGDASLKVQCEPHFKLMGKSTKYYGEEAGKGTKMKLVVNATMGTMMAAAAEGVGVIEKCGFAATDLMEVIGEGAMACPMFTMKTKNIAAQSYPPAFPLKHAHKDMRFALGLSEDVSSLMPVAAAAEAEYAKSARQDEDFSAIAENFRQ